MSRQSTRLICPRCRVTREVRGRVLRQGAEKHCRPCALDIRYDENRPARFWARVAKSDGCWTWLGVLDPQGYGSFSARRGQGGTGVHRYAYELLVGPIPAGLEIDHLCRNRGCVNPEHLEPVTRHENWRRGRSFSAVNRDKTHCPRGHEYTAENTYHLPSGSRWCRTCKRNEGREWMRKQRERKRAAERAFHLPRGEAA